jgi:uncharacterized protein YigE (DUF2233 family)
MHKDTKIGAITGKLLKYDFAKYFQKKGCKNALYLDGQISQMFLNETLFSLMNEDLGVLIGVTK